MATAFIAAKIVAGAALTIYLATRKVDKVKEGSIIIDYRKNPEALNGIIH